MQAQESEREPQLMDNPTVVFRGPGEVGFHDLQAGTPMPGQVVLRARRTLISPGTELTILAGAFPKQSAWADYGRFPFVAGYSSACDVVELGAGVETLSVGDVVAASTPHTRFATADAAGLTRVDVERVPLDLVPLSTLAETVMNSVRRAQVGWGDSVVVFGLGILGQLAVRFARLSGARPVIGIDVVADRVARLPNDPAIVAVDSAIDDAAVAVAAATRGRMATVVFEVTGAPDLIPSEFALLRPRQGRFVLLSSPRDATSSFNFHDLSNAPSHTIIGTHISSHPEVETLDNPWTRTRNSELFFDLIGDGELDLEPLVTHRLPYTSAAEAYRMLLADRTKALGVVLDWDRAE